MCRITVSNPRPSMHICVDRMSCQVEIIVTTCNEAGELTSPRLVGGPYPSQDTVGPDTLTGKRAGQSSTPTAADAFPGLRGADEASRLPPSEDPVAPAREKAPPLPRPPARGGNAADWRGAARRSPAVSADQRRLQLIA